MPGEFSDMLLLVKRNTCLILLFTIGFINALAQVESCVGLAGTYATRQTLTGIGLNSQFLFTEKFALTPELNMNFPSRSAYANDMTGDVIKESYRTSVLALDANVFFAGRKKFESYFLMGVNIAWEKTTTEALTRVVRRNNEIGLNLGIGANVRMFDRFLPYVQAKYEGNTAQLVYSAGIRYQYNK